MAIAPLADEQIVYRSVTRAKDLEGDQVRVGAFRLRDGEVGLSVDYNVAVPDGCGVGLKRKLAIVSLLTGSVRGVPSEPPLDVIPDTETHAEIVNLPPPGAMFPPEYDPRFLSVVSDLIIRAVLRVEWKWNASSL